MTFRAAVRVLAPAGRRGRLSILIFHRVLARPDPLFPQEPDARRFDEILGWLSQWFDVMPLDDGLEQLRSGTLPPSAASITFDDGYEDNVTQALPILARHGMTATFFVATGFLDGGCMWNDDIIESVRECRGDQLDLRAEDLGLHPLGTPMQRRKAIDELLAALKYMAPASRSSAVDRVRTIAGVRLGRSPMMSSQQVRQLHAAGMQIGAHTCTHPILARLDTETARAEIVRSKTALEALLQREVSFFAYPNGKPGQDYEREHAEIVRDAGFRAAVSTAPGVATALSDCFQLPRFTPWDRTRARFGLRMIMNLTRNRPALA